MCHRIMSSSELQDSVVAVTLNTAECLRVKELLVVIENVGLKHIYEILDGVAPLIANPYQYNTTIGKVCPIHKNCNSKSFRI